LRTRHPQGVHDPNRKRERPEGKGLAIRFLEAVRSISYTAADGPPVATKAAREIDDSPRVRHWANGVP